MIRIDARYVDYLRLHGNTVQGRLGDANVEATYRTRNIAWYVYNKIKGEGHFPQQRWIWHAHKITLGALNVSS
jgi:hypothetical protein